MKSEASAHRSSPGSAVAHRPPGERVAGWLETAAFFVLLMIVAMRPLISETYDSAVNLFAQRVGGFDVTTPATTAWFDLFIWLAATMAAAAAALGGRRWRWTGVEVGAALMGVAAVISTVTTEGNRRLAVNASVDWLSALALLVVLANLCRDRLRIGLVLAVVIASGTASAAKCLMQVGVEYRETLEDYEQNKARYWGETPLDDPRVALYERRLRAAEATGFIAFSNAQGALLATAGFAALAAGGAAAGGWRAVMWVVGAGLLATIWSTGSRGAMLAAAAGLGLWAVLWRARPVIIRRWRAVLLGAWLLAGLAVAAVIVLGLATGELPGSSLAFRWNYWEVTARIVAERPWTGVGAGNFDAWYLRFKPIAFPEEIKDPHNFLLATLAQWGIPGLAGLLAALAGASYVAAKGLAGGGDGGGETSACSPDTRVRTWVMWVALGFVALRIWMLRGMLGTPGGQASVIYDLGTYGLFAWLPAMAMVTWATTRVSPCADERWRAGLLAGVVVFLLVNTIDFSIFVPATLTPFAALAALLLHAREGEAARATRAGRAGGAEQATQREARAARLAPVVVAAGGLLVVMVLVAAPVLSSSGWLAVARSSPGPAVDSFLHAADADPLDPTPLAEVAHRLESSRRADVLDDAISLVEGALQRDPAAMSLHRLRARLFESRYAHSRRPSDIEEAVRSARQVVALYPDSPDDRVDLAALLARAGKATRSEEWLKEARDHYVRALELDAARPGFDEVRRWPPRRRAEVEAAMQAVSAAGPTTTRAGE